MTAKEYLGDIIGGSLMLRESRVIAELLITSPNEEQWHDAIVNDNVLQKTSVHSVKRMASTLRKRLQPMGEEFWTELLKAPDDAARQMLLMATMCQSPVLTDFMATTLSDARQMFVNHCAAKTGKNLFYPASVPLSAWINIQKAQSRKWATMYLRSSQIAGIWNQAAVKS
jgi:hypothetical protein